MIQNYGFFILLMILCAGVATGLFARYQAPIPENSDHAAPITTPGELLTLLDTMHREQCAALSAMAPGLMQLRDHGIPLADVLQGYRRFDAMAGDIYANADWDAATARREIEARCLKEVKP